MEAEVPATLAEPLVQVVFRGKKRKAYRQRTETEDNNIKSSDAYTAAPAVDHQAGNTPPVPADPSSSASPRDATDAAVTTATTTVQGAKVKGNEATGAAAAAEDEDENETGLSVAEVLRRRNARKSRLGGVKFSATDGAPSPSAVAEENGNAIDDLSLMIREEESHVLERSSSAAAGVNRRFAPQTGLSSELINKHMEEYIEAELAKRHAASSAAIEALSSSTSTTNTIQQRQQQRDRVFTTATTTNNNNRNKNNAADDVDDDDDQDEEEQAIAKIFASYAGKLTNTSQPPERHTALQGKLMEVDLGEEVRSRNAKLTERARRRLLGEDVQGDDDDGSYDSENGGRRPTKVRLGRDGKPWRPRNRRGSDDVKRDQIVEAILHENRLEVYEPPIASTSNHTGDAAAGAAEAGAGDNTNPEGGEDDAADDRIAEQFRREFMEAMAERRQRRKRPPAPPSKSANAGAKKESDEILRGPKLGGSRNARAAMRDILLKQQEERKASQPGGGSRAGTRRGRR